LIDLPNGYSRSRIVLMPRDPQWAYSYWDTPSEHKEELQQQGGQRLALRFYDVTDIDLNQQKPHSMQQYEVEEYAREWYLPVPLSDRDYLVDIGYLTADGRWLLLARSNSIRIPPVYLAGWVDDQFATIAWDDDLSAKPYGTFDRSSYESIHDAMLAMAQPAEAQRVAGSLYGSMQQVPGSAQQVVSSFAMGSGVGMERTMSGVGLTMSGVGMERTMSGVGLTMSGVGMERTMSGVGLTMSGVGIERTMSGVGLTMSGVGIERTMSGVGLTMSGVGFMMSGIGLMSGIGFSASMPPIRTRKFWLLADAELIIYGATEPDATVTIAGRPIKLNPDGTFQFRMSFQDGLLDFPILAIAADGEQNRAIHMRFTRETPERRTNSKGDAIEEVF
jgi:hypothetical protein